MMSSLLSQAWVAFIIECDNEFEHRMPPQGKRPWLTSMAMWYTCMRYVGPGGITIGDLERAARTPTNLNGMQRWRYIDVEPGPQKIVRATRAGMMAKRAWDGLVETIEERWAGRFDVDRLKMALRALDEDMLPDCMPILHYGLRTPVEILSRPEGHTPDDSLPALMARVLLRFAINYEQRSKLSLAIGANVLRVLNEDGIALRDIPRLAGVSKESVSMAMGILKKGLVVEGPAPSGRGKAFGLNDLGLAAQRKYPQLAGSWVDGPLQTSLEEIAPRLWEGLKPYPDGWRAKVKPPEVLPHYPMVLHRGGYPDGS